MDINTPLTTRTGNLHGMPLSMLIKGVPEVCLPKIISTEKQKIRAFMQNPHQQE